MQGVCEAYYKNCNYQQIEVDLVELSVLYTCYPLVHWDLPVEKKCSMTRRRNAREHKKEKYILLHTPITNHQVTFATTQYGKDIKSKAPYNAKRSSWTIQKPASNRLTGTIPSSWTPFNHHLRPHHLDQ